MSTYFVILLLERTDSDSDDDNDDNDDDDDDDDDGGGGDVDVDDDDDDYSNDGPFAANYYMVQNPPACCRASCAPRH